MRHPLDFVSPASRKPLFFAFLALTLVLFAIFRALDTPLRTSAAPSGIVSFELAGSTEKAFQVMASWESACSDCPAVDRYKAHYYAAFGLGLDYLFMPAYALALSLGILLAASRHTGVFAKIGAWLGWGALAAALFDAVENFALWQLLTGDFQAVWPRLAAICATVKFALLLLGLAYALIGWLWPARR